MLEKAIKASASRCRKLLEGCIMNNRNCVDKKMLPAKYLPTITLHIAVNSHNFNFYQVRKRC